MIQNKKILEKELNSKNIKKIENNIQQHLENVVSPDELYICEIIKLIKLMLEDEKCGLCEIIDELKDNSKKWDLDDVCRKFDLDDVFGSLILMIFQGKKILMILREKKILMIFQKNGNLMNLITIFKIMFRISKVLHKGPI